jgi:putative endopeptidase
MPDRDYYLKADARFADTRTKYRGYIETMLKLGGVTGTRPAADAIFALEMKIAELHWPREKSRNRDLTYNPKSRAELVSFAPEFPWGAAFESFGAPAQDFFIVAQLDAVQGLAKLFRETPVATWRSYLTFHYLNTMADVLPKSFDDASFDFNGRVITGQPAPRDRWKRAVIAMSGPSFQAPMGEAVGQLYVVRNFMPQAKAAMDQLVGNLRAAYKVRIAKLPWMTDETKKAALRKLEKIRVKIGYPDQWRDYAPLDIKAGDAYGNRKRELAFNRRRDVTRLARPADRNDWGMAPQTVNAYYSSTWNEIVFPAAILQPPFFDLNADPAVNYGGIGAVIGHEMGHGFDDQGAKSDENGILRAWWNAQDEQSFKALVDKLAAQYSKFEALPGLFVNGRLTLGENIGDLGGLNVSLEAYKISLGGKEPPLIDGFTGVQRFFLGFGQIWRELIRAEALRNQVVSDPHSPGAFRANGTVRNMDEWYDAFVVKPTAKLYLPPDQRVRIW